MQFIITHSPSKLAPFEVPYPFDEPLNSAPWAVHQIVEVVQMVRQGITMPTNRGNEMVVAFVHLVSKPFFPRAQV